MSQATLDAIGQILSAGFQGQKILDGEAFVVRKETMERMTAASAALRKAYMADMEAAIAEKSATRV